MRIHGNMGPYIFPRIKSFAYNETGLINIFKGGIIMNSFQKFMMVQCAKIAVSTALVEAAGVILGITIAEESEKKEETKNEEPEK